MIADVGGEAARHIGDEAMLEANLQRFRALIPGIAFTVVSRDPTWTALRYGVDAIPPLGFPRAGAAGAERRLMLDRLLAEARSGVRGNATIDGVAAADAVVVSGGGNLSSSWPDLLYERVALLHLAHILERPSIVLGQTLGPGLGSDGFQLLAEILPTARYVAVRELPSAALGLSLGVPHDRLWYQFDDAQFFEGPPASRVAAPAIAVTIDPQIRATSERLFDALAQQLRRLSTATGAPITLVPHVFGDESLPSDLTEARLLAERLNLPNVVIAEGLSATEARQLTRESAMVISSRYHPIVFALGAGVPALGIYGDEYCRIKLQGALAQVRLEHWTLAYDDVASSKLLTQALELWRVRDEVRRGLESRSESWREDSKERWAAIIRALDPAASIPPAHPARLFGRPIEEVAPMLVFALEARRLGWERERQVHEKGVAKFEEVAGYARSLENQLGIRKALGRYAAAVQRRLRRARR
jgi:polysaccharide pyruvyl transferase WcaK-like protein